MTSDQQSPPPKPEDKPPSGLSAFWAELKRRKVMRVAITYAVVAWLIIQIAVSTFPSLYIPQWALSLVIMCVLLGFPVAIILAWAFELTPDGIKTTKFARQENVDTEAAASHSKKRNWLAYAVGALFPTVIFGALALFFNIRFGDVTQETDGDKSIAVLPLENMSPDPKNAFFADGVHEDILTNLSKVKDFLVIGRTSTLQYRQTVKTLRQIAQELEVRYLVEGSVRRAVNQVQVTVQLIDSQTGGHLWAENYKRDLDDIFIIQAEIAKEIAAQLKAVLSHEEVENIERRPTENQKAYDLFLQSRTVSLRERVPVLQKATELDPEFYEAWYDMAKGQLLDWRFFARGTDPKLLESANQALDQIKRLAPESGETLSLQADFADMVENDLEKALRFDLKAKALGVGGSNVGLRYLQLGRLDEARFNTEEAFRLDPLDWDIASRLYLIYLYLGLWDKARDLMEEFQERTDKNVYNRGWYHLLDQLDFIKGGDLESYLAARKSALNEEENPSEDRKVWTSFVSRDHHAALKYLEADPSMAIYLFGPGGGHYDHGLFVPTRGLLQALLWFDLGNKEQWLKEARKNLVSIERFKKRSTMVNPSGWSINAICYGLEGDREKVDALAKVVRQESQDPNLQFRFEALCEMHLAIAYLTLGDHEKAIDLLEAASKMDSPIFVNRELDLWFIFDRLKGNPRFDALLEE